MPVLQWLENLPISVWIQISPSIWAFPMFLFVHTIGISILAGGNTMIAAALLGLWPSNAAIKPLEKLYPLMWVAFGTNAFTGIGLLIADATTKGANPDFWIKMIFVFGGVALMVQTRKRIFRNPALDQGPLPDGARTLAVASLFCWFAAIVAGRLIAYVGPVPGLN